MLNVAVNSKAIKMGVLQRLIIFRVKPPSGHLKNYSRFWVMAHWLHSFSLRPSYYLVIIKTEVIKIYLQFLSKLILKNPTFKQS